MIGLGLVWCMATWWRDSSHSRALQRILARYSSGCVEVQLVSMVAVVGRGMLLVVVAVPEDREAEAAWSMPRCPDWGSE